MNQRCFRVGSEESGVRFREHRATNQRSRDGIPLAYSEEMGGEAACKWPYLFRGVGRTSDHNMSRVALCSSSYYHHLYGESHSHAAQQR